MNDILDRLRRAYLAANDPIAANRLSADVIASPEFDRLSVSDTIRVMNWLSGYEEATFLHRDWRDSDRCWRRT